MDTPTSDVRRGRFSKRLVTAYPTQTWWYNITLLTRLITRLKYMVRILWLVPFKGDFWTEPFSVFCCILTLADFNKIPDCYHSVNNMWTLEEGEGGLH